MTMKRIIIGLLATTISAVFAASAFAQNATVVVLGNTSAGENQPGWLFNRDLSTTTPYGFTNSVASTGYGSLYVPPIGPNPSDKFIAENFVNTAIADIDSISYDFLIGSGGTASDKVQFYMNVYANFGLSDDLKYYDCRYNVVPTAGSTASFTTVTFDPTLAYPVTTRGSSPFTCPAVPADMDTLSAGSNIRMFALNVGDSVASDVGLNGFLDKVVVAKTGGTTTYDFEPYLVATNANQCKNGGWANYRRANGSTFKNQGDCVSYTQNGK